MAEQSTEAATTKEPSGITGGIRLLLGLVLFFGLLRLCSYNPPDPKVEFISKCVADGIAHRADLRQYEVESRCQDAWRAANR